MWAVCGLLCVAFIAETDDSGACFTDFGALDQIDCEDIVIIYLCFFISNL